MHFFPQKTHKTDHFQICLYKQGQRGDVCCDVSIALPMEIKS